MGLDKGQMPVGRDQKSKHLQKKKIESHYVAQVMNTSFDVEENIVGNREEDNVATIIFSFLHVILKLGLFKVVTTWGCMVENYLSLADSPFVKFEGKLDLDLRGFKIYRQRRSYIYRHNSCISRNLEKKTYH